MCRQIISVFPATILMFALPLLLLCSPDSSAQTDENPVYVDDSPRAWELFRRAQDQEKENPGEAARLYQELLSSYAMKLIPVSETDDNHLASVRSRVHRALIARESVLERYRLIETPEADRMLAGSKLNMLVNTRLLTEPALEASIRLAQIELEKAQFVNAIRLLKEIEIHPDLSGRRSAYRWLMLGLAANHVEDITIRNEAISKLNSSNDPDFKICHDELMRLLQTGPGPEVITGITVLDVGPEAKLGETLGRPIWSVTLEESLFRRRHAEIDFNDRTSNATLDSDRRRGQWMTVTPTVAGRVVYINEGEVVRAYDRFSQREFWRTELGRGAGFIMPRGNNSIGDMNVVAVNGKSLVAIAGHASSDERIGTNRVVCINTDTGQIRWSINFERLQGLEEYEGLFPYGAPVIANGNVFILARKVTGRQLLVSTYLVAINLQETDRSKLINWVQYIASSGKLQQTDNRPFTTLTYDSGDIFVATSLGAVAKIDSARGEIIWLKRIEGIFRLPPDTQPWEMPAPIVTHAGIIAPSPDHKFILLLNRETGMEIARYESQKWGSPRYLLTNGNMVFAVGEDVHGLSIDALEIPVWSLHDPEINERKFLIRGRVQLAGAKLIIPTRTSLLAVDGDTGFIENEIELYSAGNPLAVGQELFIAHTDSLQAYMPLAVAEERLREQIKLAPADPGPALSLVRIAARSVDPRHSVDLALEAAELTSKALVFVSNKDKLEQAQHELFNTLVEIASNNPDIDYERGSALHGQIGVIAANPQQRIEHLLAKGDWLMEYASTHARTRLANAIESYQAILTDDNLSSNQLNSGDLIKPAAAVATQKLAKIIEKFGSNAYAPLAVNAQRSFDTAMARPRIDTAELLSIYRRYPFAEVSRNAGMQAVELLIAEGYARKALGVLNELYVASTRENDHKAIIGEIVNLCVNNDWSTLATEWLEVARKKHDLRELPLKQVNISIVNWFDKIMNLNIPDEPVSVGRINNDVEIADYMGGLLPGYDKETVFPSTYALIQNGTEIIRREGENFNAKWRTNVPDNNAQLLQTYQMSILLWLPGSGGEVLAINSEDGKELWRTGELRETLYKQRKRGLRREATRMDIADGRRRKDPLEPLPLPSSDSLIVVGRSGGITRYETNNAGELEVIWKKDHPLTEVHFAARHDLAIVLAGVMVSNIDRKRKVGTVVLLDPLTGEVFNELETRNQAEMRWMKVTPKGLAVIGTSAAIEAFDLASGERVWTNIAKDVDWYVRSWVQDDFLVMADNTIRIKAINLADGSMSEAFKPRNDGLWQPVRLEEIHSQGNICLAMYGQRLVWYGPDGRLMGQDSIAVHRRFTHVIPAADMVVAISHIQSPNANNGQRRGTDYVNMIWLLSHNGKVLGSYVMPAERMVLDAAILIDGWLLLDNHHQTLAIPTNMQ